MPRSPRVFGESPALKGVFGPLEGEPDHFIEDSLRMAVMAGVE
jgi:hypothetical protein